MYRYRHGVRSVGVQRGVDKHSEHVFYVEAHSGPSSNFNGSCRIEFSRSEALALRRNLSKLLAGTRETR